jgi:hypothetical protein
MDMGEGRRRVVSRNLQRGRYVPFHELVMGLGN